jgi:NTP pyrophosphatase (non-canonical NTP hydrolase)
LALSIEAAELNEIFLWKKSEEAEVEKIKDELADVFAYAILLAEKYDLDINEIVKNKVKKTKLNIRSVNQKVSQQSTINYEIICWLIR